MKKITIVFIIAMFLLGNFYCYADNKNTNIGIELKGVTNISKTEKIYTLTVCLGNFTEEIEKHSVMGYEAILDYDAKIFEKVSIKGLNGWSSNYNNNTKVLIGDTEEAKANTEITQIIFTLKEDIQPTITEIALKDMLLTDDQNDFEYNKKIAITITETEEKETKTEKADQNDQENSKQTNQPDNSIAKKELPKAGIEIIILIGILIFIGIIWVSGKGYISYLEDVKK